MLYTRESQIGVGTELYWNGSADFNSLDQLSLYDTVVSVSEGVYTTSQYGSLSVVPAEEVKVNDPDAEASMRKLASADSLTPYLKDNPGRWVITGGAV